MTPERAIYLLIALAVVVGIFVFLFKLLETL